MGYDAALFDHDGALVTMASLDAHREAARAAVDAAFVRRSHRADAAFEAEPDYEVDGLDGVVALLRE
ncbi:hypothetical protein [Halomicrobium salinisoli]|uniref:hypothetical protein n=1 Tax=Halomicrobium salinisoli TaxID=2878391 RepID=UPI001CF0620E|nr:hypothetical protein [Halomicrobium salinisoli]